MRYLESYISFVDRLSERVGQFASLLTVLLVAVVCLNVALRYIGGGSLLALQDLSWYMFGTIFFLGAGYTFRHGRHVRVDVFYGNLSPKTQAWIDIVGLALLFLPFCILGISMSLEFVANAFAIREGSPDPGGLPARYIIKAVIPLGFTLLLIDGSAIFCRRLLELKTGVPESELD